MQNSQIMIESNIMFGVETAKAHKEETMDGKLFLKSEKGYFGEGEFKFGGCFIPEILYPALHDLQKAYKQIFQTKGFQKELKRLFKTFVGRPTPLIYAKNASAILGNEIYLKFEGLANTGAHKINNALAQVLLAKRMKKQHIIAETGAGQHGVAVASVCAFLKIPCTIFMGATDMQRQRPNVFIMEQFGAEVVSVESGTKTLKDAVNEALRHWSGNPHSHFYVLGSALGPYPYPDIVRDSQAIIGKEIKKQIRKVLSVYANTFLPDYVVACVGGGSNAIGAFAAFLEDEEVRLIGVEAGGDNFQPNKHAMRLTSDSNASVGIAHGFRSYFLQDKHGQLSHTHSISAGLDYAGVGPQLAHLGHIGRVDFRAASDEEALEALQFFARHEGILPALESSHALAGVLEIAKTEQNKIIVVNVSGRGDKDIFITAKALCTKAWRDFLESELHEVEKILKQNSKPKEEVIEEQKQEEKIKQHAEELRLALQGISHEDFAFVDSAITQEDEGAIQKQTTTNAPKKEQESITKIDNEKEQNKIAKEECLDSSALDSNDIANIESSSMESSNTESNKDTTIPLSLNNEETVQPHIPKEIDESIENNTYSTDTKDLQGSEDTQAKQNNNTLSPLHFLTDEAPMRQEAIQEESAQEENRENQEDKASIIESKQIETTQAQSKEAEEEQSQIEEIDAMQTEEMQREKEQAQETELQNKQLDETQSKEEQIENKLAENNAKEIAFTEQAGDTHVDSQSMQIIVENAQEAECNIAQEGLEKEGLEKGLQEDFTKELEKDFEIDVEKDFIEDVAEDFERDSANDSINSISNIQSLDNADISNENALHRDIDENNKIEDANSTDSINSLATAPNLEQTRIDLESLLDDSRQDIEITEPTHIDTPNTLAQELSLELEANDDETLESLQHLESLLATDMQQNESLENSIHSEEIRSDNQEACDQKSVNEDMQETSQGVMQEATEENMQEVAQNDMQNDMQNNLIEETPQEAYNAYNTQDSIPLESTPIHKEESADTKSLDKETSGLENSALLDTEYTIERIKGQDSTLASILDVDLRQGVQGENNADIKSFDSLLFNTNNETNPLDPIASSEQGDRTREETLPQDAERNEANSPFLQDQEIDIPYNWLSTEEMQQVTEELEEVANASLQDTNTQETQKNLNAMLHNMEASLNKEREKLPEAEELQEQNILQEDNVQEVGNLSQIDGSEDTTQDVLQQIDDDLAGIFGTAETTPQSDNIMDIETESINEENEIIDDEQIDSHKDDTRIEQALDIETANRDENQTNQNPIETKEIEHTQIAQARANENTIENLYDLKEIETPESQNAKDVLDTEETQDTQAKKEILCTSQEVVTKQEIEDMQANENARESLSYISAQGAPRVFKTDPELSRICGKSLKS